MMKRFGFASVSMAALTFLIAGSMALPSHAALTTNLVPNPSFELHYLPPAVVAAAYNQPVWPQNWLAEGATELFDHTPQHHKDGSYSAGISGSWSGPRTVCEPTCMTLPGGAQRDTAYQYYSVAPAWRSQTAIVVSPGTYTFSAWMKLTIPKTNTGAETRVRWLNSLGQPIGWIPGPKLIATEAGANYTNFIDDADWDPSQGPKKFNEQSTGWLYGYANVIPPAGATRAILLLGYTDDAWLGGVHYDRVCFTKQNAPLIDICRTTFAT